MIDHGATIAYYSEHAGALAERYESVSFEDVHGSRLRYLPRRGRALDIGSGSGRDAAALAERGLEVTAVEPSNELRQSASALHGRCGRIRWLSSSLPDLRGLDPRKRFDLVMMTGVGMHLSPEEMPRALLRVESLMSARAMLLMQLRMPAPDVPGSWEHDPAAVLAAARAADLSVVMHEIEPDRLGREGVSWAVFALRADKRRERSVARARPLRQGRAR